MSKTNPYDTAAFMLNIGSLIADGSAARASGKYSATQHFYNAKQRLKSGEQDANNIRQKGNQMVSNAKVAMVAQGGVVDESILARLKQNYDIDAATAMFDARSQANADRAAGRVAEMEGRQKYRANIMRVVSSALAYGSSFKSPGRPPTPNPHKAHGYG